MTRNARERTVSPRAWLRTADFLAGYREAWHGRPPDSDARPCTRAACRYELGRQMAIWMRSHGMAAKRPTPPSVKNLKRWSRETGLPHITGGTT